MSSKSYAVVVPWFDTLQLNAFLDAWNVSAPFPDWLVLQQDETRAGCAATKNAGIDQAVRRGAEVVVVLDDDCHPDPEGPATLPELAVAHRAMLEPRPVELFQVVTDPPSRGTPYHPDSRRVTLPVAASMGFWTEVGDYCAPRQLVHVGAPMRFRTDPVYGRYFPLSGMNLAFRPAEWLPWCRFIDVPRFDDIWMGWLWQREAYRRGHCFNLAGPLVRHSRQSNVWQNLRAESCHLEVNETLWRDIALHPDGSYDALTRLLPRDSGGSDR